jgi:hypothetical protein
MSESDQFYRRSLELLQEAQVPFLLGGAYALCVYTGIARHTKDFDLFVRESDFEAALGAFAEAGYRTEKTFPHWLGKAFRDDESIDIIFRAGNGLCPVGDLWFERAPEAEVFGLRTRLSPPEEMIWMKAYIMERERYDGADVAHLILHCAEQIDWEHLVRCFGPDWRVLLSHLLLFGFIFPSEKERIPQEVVPELLRRIGREGAEPEADTLICRGTFLSRAQFLVDVREGLFEDARLIDPRSEMDAAAIEKWTEAIDPQVLPQVLEPHV